MECWGCQGANGPAKWRGVPAIINGKNLATAVAFLCDVDAGAKSEDLKP